MESKKSKVGISGKYGTRYGSKLRKQVQTYEILKRMKYTSPFSGKNSIRRKAAGIWYDKSTGRTIAGGAWEFSTNAAQVARATINRLKKLNSESKEEIKEETGEDISKEKKKPKSENERKTIGKRKKDKKE